VYRDELGRAVLTGDGSYEFTAVVDGADLVVRDVTATWFGGDQDPMDSGMTASGVVTRGHPDLMGCALPQSGRHCEATEGSPLPRLPWHTCVQVYNRATHAVVKVELIDVGPAKPPRAHAAIDLTQAAFRALGGTTGQGVMAVDYRVFGGARYLPSEIREELGIPGPG
jgi:hypothetical protein